MGRFRSLKESFDAAAYRPPGWHEGYFTNRYDHRIRYGHAPAQTPCSRGTVILTHGYGEFIELYYQAMQEYQKMGFDVWMMDFYGFGKSGRDNPENPHRPSAKGMLRHVRDLDFFIRNIVSRDRTKPIVLSAHSMGGHIGLLYLERHPGVFNAAVMSSPMFDIYRFGLPRAARPLIRTIFNIASAIGLKDTEVPATPDIWDKLTRVGNVLASPPNGLRETFNQMMRQAFPETHIDRPTFGWIAKAFSTIARSMKGRLLRSVSVPVLIGSAGIENLVDPHAHERAARLMPDATLLKIPTAHHGLWFEDDGNYDTWVGGIRRFLDRVCPRQDPACPSCGPAAGDYDPAKIAAAFPIPARQRPAPA